VALNPLLRILGPTGVQSRSGDLHSALPWADPRRGGDLVSAERSDVPWEGAGIDRTIGAPDAVEVVRRLTQIEPPEAALDAAFSSGQ
jgi:hypothetical protein